jgi:pyridoxamine 5'-phosphate oxidase family protein
VDSLYTPAQRGFLRAQQSGRLLTVAPGGAPEATPVLYQMNGDVVVAGGVDLTCTPAWDDVRRHGRAVLVVDEIVAGSPARSRGVRLEAVATVDSTRPRPILRLHAEHVRSWGLEDGE